MRQTRFDRIDEVVKTVRRRAHRGGSRQGDQQVQDRQALRLSPSPMTLAVTRWQDQIDAEAVLDGFYVLRTPSPRTSSTRPPWSPRTAIPLTLT